MARPDRARSPRAGRKQQLYGVFAGSVRGGRFALTTNKALALRTAKKHGGWVRSVNLAGSPSVWDAPTFNVTGKMVKDFRKG